MQKGQYVTHVVTDGDTIQSIGLFYNVNWTEIVTLNGLNYPYVVTDLYDTEFTYQNDVAKIGTKLLIPNNLTVPVKSIGSSKEIEKYAYGSDLDLYTTERSVFGNTNLESEGQLTDDGEGDVLLVQGLDNLSQQLITRLGTEKGSLLLHPEYGSNLLSYVGKKILKEQLIDIKLEVQECLLSDFRVQSVGKIDVWFKDTSTRVEAEVYPIEPYSKPFLLGATFTK